MYTDGPGKQIGFHNALLICAELPLCTGDAEDVKRAWSPSPFYNLKTPEQYLENIDYVLLPSLIILRKNENSA